MKQCETEGEVKEEASKTGGLERGQASEQGPKHLKLACGNTASRDATLESSSHFKSSALICASM